MIGEAMRIWILGAPDPEMGAIEALLRDCGERVVSALDDRGQRVTPATAYRCPVPEVPAGSTVYAVECIDTLPDGWARIDHHRPGDPGYGRPPAEFMAASSLGQVIAELARLGRLPPAPRPDGGISSSITDDGWDRGLPSWVPWQRGQLSAGTPGRWVLQGYRGMWAVAEAAAEHPRYRRAVYIPTDIIFVAAADHCLGAAYAGECPGVDPDELMRWRVEQRAKFQGRSAEQILADIERARELLSETDSVELAPGVRVADVRGYCVVTHDCGHKELRHEDHITSHKHGCPGSRDGGEWCNGWTVAPGVPELPDAAARDGVAYLATVSDGRGQKVVLGGCTQPETVRAFLEHWAPRQGLVDLYGDPARGFAGGYLP